MILDNYEQFLDKIFSEIGKLRLNVTGFELDHIAYTVSSDKEYDTLKPEVLKFSELLRENIISERRVGVFKFFKPLKYKDYVISALELIEPKADEKTNSQLEHAEFIVDTNSLSEFANRYPNLPWIKANIDRNQFPRLKLLLGNGLEIKFHLTSILSE